MEVEQAVYTSMRTRKAQGYQLVAVSAGVTDPVSRLLATWGPSHAALVSDDPRAESLNFHHLTDEWYAVSRTVYGGAEYSGRGGLQVFTRYLLLREEQLRGYANNALELARTANALGLLRLSIKTSTSDLPRLDLPDRPITATKYETPRARCYVEAERHLRAHQRVALIGIGQPTDLLGSLIHAQPLANRLELSFSTGLKPSLERKFSLQFSPRVTPALNAQFSSMGIQPIMAS